MITYSHKGALYVNMTNLCTNKCTFCLRSKTNGIFDELWYNGNVYALSTNEDKADSERSTMLFRTFPISDEVKENWGIDEYESYVANATQVTTNAN